MRIKLMLMRTTSIWVFIGVYCVCCMSECEVFVVHSNQTRHSRILFFSSLMRQPNNNKFDWVLKFIDFISHLEMVRERRSSDAFRRALKRFSKCKCKCFIKIQTLQSRMFENDYQIIFEPAHAIVDLTSGKCESKTTDALS